MPDRVYEVDAQCSAHTRLDQRRVEIGEPELGFHDSHANAVVAYGARELHDSLPRCFILGRFGIRDASLPGGLPPAFVALNEVTRRRGRDGIVAILVSEHDLGDVELREQV